MKGDSSYLGQIVYGNCGQASLPSVAIAMQAFTFSGQSMCVRGGGVNMPLTGHSTPLASTRLRLQSYVELFYESGAS